VLVVAALSCSRPAVEKISEFDIDGIHVRANLPRNSVLTIDQTEKISGQVSNIIRALNPVDGDVLGKLNDSVVGEMIPTAPVANVINQAVKSSYDSYGAFDPTLQILWDVYDFELGGRYVSVAELADALRWVDYRRVELYEDKILRKGENVRFGLGPALSGALLDILMAEFGAENIAIDDVSVGGTGIGKSAEACLSASEENPAVFDFVYPIEQPAQDAPQSVFGHVRLNPGEFAFALDDDENFFYTHGSRYHMVLDPLTGLPTDEVRAVLIVSKISCTHAATMAYAVMVMGKIRGLEYFDENSDIEGIILLDEGEVNVSSGLGDRFWR